jgi:hypothetical protein
MRFCPVCGGARVTSDRLEPATPEPATWADLLLCHHSPGCSVGNDEWSHKVNDNDLWHRFRAYYRRGMDAVQRPVSAGELVLLTAWGFEHRDGTPPTTADLTVIDYWPGDIRWRYWPDLSERPPLGSPTEEET